MNVTLLVFLAQASGAASNPTRVDQLPVPVLSTPPRRMPIGPDKPAQAATITQLPSDLHPVAESQEAGLVEPPVANASSHAAAEVARAVGVIRGRGQQVTPELLAREVGPDVLESYLARPDAALPPTGLPNEASSTVAPVPGVTIIPPTSKP